MPEIRCGIRDSEGNQCDTVIQVEEPLSPNARYVCRFHSKSVQTVFFQEFQFDKDMRRSQKPTGTRHIRRQGSETNDHSDLYLTSMKPDRAFKNEKS